jgi:hypothetical protein
MKSSIFWDITPCSLLKVNRRFGETCCLHIQCRRISQSLLATGFMLVSCFAYSSILKMKTCSSAMSVDFQLTTQRHIAETRALNFRIILDLRGSFTKPFNSSLCLDFQFVSLAMLCQWWMIS